MRCNLFFPVLHGRCCIFFFSSRRRHTRYWRDWSSDVCSSDLGLERRGQGEAHRSDHRRDANLRRRPSGGPARGRRRARGCDRQERQRDRRSRAPEVRRRHGVDRRRRQPEDRSAARGARDGRRSDRARRRRRAARRNRGRAEHDVADAFGNELQQAENASAALMQAHWPGIADRGSDYVQDLACIAALYGLAPRGATPIPVADEAACPPLATDETVEQFREHLERYVRTFLEGTTTVQGILRIVAEALALHIADAYADLDTWWARAADGLSATEPRGDGAAEAIFGTRAPSVRGVAPSAARVAGRVDLRSGADLRDAAHLVLSVDGAAPVDVDLSAHANASPATFGADVAAAIRGAVPALDARIERGRLVLESRTTGPASALEVLAADGDAAPALLGLPRRHYRGSAATGASVTGTVALDGGIDFSAPGAPRYLRLRIDGTRSFEIDCAGAPAPKTLAEITSAINAQAGFALASNDGHVLTVTSPTVGFGSSIAFEPAAAEDATAALFGAPPLFTAGRDAQPARAAGIKDNAAGVDLSAGSTIQVSTDGDPLVTID